MPTFDDYNGLEVLPSSPAPTGAGGVAINNNFKKLSSKLSTSIPTTSNDSTENYAQGSRWFNTASKTEYICLDASVGAAVWVQVAASTSTDIVTVGFVLDGAGVIIPAGSAGYKEIAIAGTLVGWTVLSNASDTFTIDIKRCTYSNFPTTTSITGAGTKPNVSSAVKGTGTNFASWTSTSISALDILEFVVGGTPAAATKVWVFLRMIVS